MKESRARMRIPQNFEISLPRAAFFHAGDNGRRKRVTATRYARIIYSIPVNIEFAPIIETSRS